MPPEPDTVIHQLVVADAAAIAEIVELAHTSDDVTTVVAAALFAPADDDLMSRAATLAVTARDRQLVAIAAAHLRGDSRSGRGPGQRPPRRPPRQRSRRLDHSRQQPARHQHPRGSLMTTVPTARVPQRLIHRRSASPLLVSTLVQVAAHRARLPAIRLHRPPRRRTASTPCRQHCSTVLSPAQGSAPHSGRCSATVA